MAVSDADRQQAGGSLRTEASALSSGGFNANGSLLVFMDSVMACQRIFVATLAGEAAAATANLFISWRSAASAVETGAVDRFWASLRDNAASLPIVYFSEWIDRWLMGDIVPGLGTIEGRRFQTACFSREEAIDWASRCGSQYQEQAWLAARLREGATAWSELVDQVVVVVVREVFEGSTADEEIKVSLGVEPEWLGGISAWSSR